MYNVNLVKGDKGEMKKVANPNKRKTVTLSVSFTEKEYQQMKLLSGLKGNVEKDQIIKAYLKTKLTYGY